MAASNETVREILKVVRKHVNEHTLRLIVRDLGRIEGNTSFKDTVRKMQRELGGA